MYGIENNIQGNDVQLSGMFLAKVIRNPDSKAQERVWVRVMGIHDMENTDKEYGIWAHHLAYSKANSGEIPEIDDWLWVSFPDQYSPNLCLWHGWCRVSL